MDRHVTLLGILASLSGALAMLVGVSMLLLSAGALNEVIDPVSAAVELAAGITAAAFFAIAIFSLLWGGAHLWAGALLRRRRPLGRFVTLALAVVNLLALPYGTALGIYALWVLLTNDGRRLFEPAR